MRYTYHVSLEGLAKDLAYLTLTFDRTISSDYMGVKFPNIDPKVETLLYRIGNTRGVVKPFPKGQGSDYSSSALISADGQKLVVKLTTPTPETLPETVNQIVKKVQRMYAKGESRKRVQIKKLNEYVNKLNNLAYGK